MLEAVSKTSVCPSSGATAKRAALRQPGVLSLCFAIVAFVFACEREPLASGLALKWETNCSFCHGNEKNAAPPLSLDGFEDRGDIGVGAHQAHLDNGSIAEAFECEACHVIPESVDEPGHRAETQKDKESEVIFGGLARTANSNPTWDRDTARCADVYCHGATLSGGERVALIWTAVEERQIDCDACHGSPPPLPHIQRIEITDCATCHPGTVDERGDIRLAEARHINGKIDAVTECYTCHGKKDGNAAPPPALNGSEDTNDNVVGAHQSHLQDGVNSKAVPCDACHVVPEAVGDPGHQPEGPDDTYAEVTFGELARGDNLLPSWDRKTARCANTYCHGASLSGGKHTEPTWTRVDNSQIDCDGCHGSPPPSPHPQSEPNAHCLLCHPDSIEEDEPGPPHPKSSRTMLCEACHPDTVDPFGEIRVSEGKHIDGTVDSQDKTASPGL
ncbi:MAG: CxxxxCH/CxxCH domain-containing protein [Deltaproteobacteria bacterium]|nr:CxxxxCH/CxxCH domain-containing protein [Deltaproteobacteria bacterium]